MIRPSLLRTACGLGAAAVVASALIATASPGSAQQGPIRLFPERPAPAEIEPVPEQARPRLPAPSGPPVLPPAEPAGRLVVEGLAAPGLDAIGLSGPAEGGFGRAFWQSSDAQLVGQLLADLPVVTRVPPLRRLAQRLLVSPAPVDGRDTAYLWADVADCVYRQNSWALCDPDNRALAIEAATTLSRQVSIAPSVRRDSDSLPRRSHSERQYQLQAARSVKDRVLSAVRSRVEDGYLTAADFGLLTHEDIRRTVSGVTQLDQNAQGPGLVVGLQVVGRLEHACLSTPAFVCHGRVHSNIGARRKWRVSAA